MPKIYCDLDGVLAGFSDAIEQFFGKRPGTDDVGPKEWARLKKDWPTFWIDLPKEKLADQLWSLIGKETNILSAVPSGWPSAATGKRIWVRRNFPKFGYNQDQQFITCLRAEKKNYAKTNGEPNILIDDDPGNIANWKAAGGVGVLYTPSKTMLNRIAELIEVERV